MKVSYDAARVWVAYAYQHPDRLIAGVYKSREAAFDAVEEKPGRKIDLSCGFFVVFDEPAGQQPHTGA